MRSSGFDPIASEIFHQRLRWASYLVLVVFGVMVLRLWSLQIVRGPEYRMKSEENRIHLRDIPPFRGMIFDRYGRLLVDNRPAYNLYIIPEEVQDLDPLLFKLSSLIGCDPEDVRAKVEKGAAGGPFMPVLIRRDLSRQELALLETNLFNLPGAMIQVKPQRHYIFADLAAHVIGYLGEISRSELASGDHPDCRPGDLVGKSGVEAAWERHLHGSRGGEQVEVDAVGRRLKVLSRKPPVPGMNLCLTIDKDLQSLAEECLDGSKGAVVAMDPRNGEVLAMASSPCFDPNSFIGGIDGRAWHEMTSGENYSLQNRAISGQYPPGSVFKIAVALAGLEEGLVDPDEEIFCGGRYRLGSSVFRCWRRGGHGEVDFRRALKESCDIYFYKLGRRLGVDRIAHYAKMLGLGRPTGIKLRGEAAGLIPSSEWKLKRFGVPWQPGESISLSIGQSFVLVTPIQMAVMMSAVFNGGTLYRPKVVQWVGKGDATAFRSKPSEIARIEAGSEHLDMIRDALVAVVNEPHGTGRRARIEGVEVAGKTGTAQVVNLEAEKLSKEGSGEVPVKYRDHAWFVAAAPAEQPEITVAVLVENAGHGGTAAAPIAGRIIRRHLLGPEGNIDQD